MGKTVTVTYGPAEGAADTAKGLEKTKEELDASGILRILNESGASVDLKQDKSLKGRISLYHQETTTEISVAELCLEADGAKRCNPAVEDRIREWIFVYVEIGRAHV